MFTNISLVLKSEKAKHLHVPMYKTLTIETILEYGGNSKMLELYLPEERDIVKLPRQWIINVIYSLCGDSFREWVAQ